MPLQIDDGGHSWNQQRTSFDVLFPAVVPGGVYILEDLLTSYWSQKEIADAPANTVEVGTVYAAFQPLRSCRMELCLLQSSCFSLGSTRQYACVCSPLSVHVL